MAYQQKLADPRWQKKRLQIMERDQFRCVSCGNDKEQLEIHHVEYWEGLQPFEYDNKSLVTLCHTCHQGEQSRGKAERYLLQALRTCGFTSFDLVGFSSILHLNSRFSEFIKGFIRKRRPNG